MRNAVFSAANEIRELKTALDGLRIELEAARLDGDARIREAKQSRRDEINYLQETIAKLREKIEERHATEESS